MSLTALFSSVLNKSRKGGQADETDQGK